MTGRGRTWVAILLALGVLAILVSPSVDSPLTALQHKHGLHPTSISVVMASHLGTVSVFAMWEASALREASLAMRAPDLVDLTTVRLC